MSTMENVQQRCDAIEECYEFMLAFAAQGVLDDRESPHGGQLRELLSRAVEATVGLPEAYAAVLSALGQATSPKYDNFLRVLKTDTANALAAMELVLMQTRISSQLIDNLNASLHIRTLLTDIFLLDEIVHLQNLN